MEEVIKTVKVKDNILYINDTNTFTGCILKPEEFDAQSLIEIYTWAMDMYLQKINPDGDCESCHV